MSDSSSVSSASSAEPSLAELLKAAREHQKAAGDILKKVAGAAKGLKAPKKKAASGEKKPRKTSDGQRRWQAFQKFIWDELKAENPAAPFKEAMKAAGPRWHAGSPLSEEDQAAFEAWLEENPIPSAEEAADAKEAKAAEAAAEKERKKAEREAAKAEKAAATKAAKAAAVKAAAAPKAAAR
jgi:colicin import membrane protein